MALQVSYTLAGLYATIFSQKLTYFELQIKATLLFKCSSNTDSGTTYKGGFFTANYQTEYKVTSFHRCFSFLLDKRTFKL